MNAEYQKTLERIERLSDSQRWAFHVFRYVQEKFHSGRNDDLNMDVIQGIPEKFLKTDSALGIATIAGQLSLITHLGFIQKDGKQVAISTYEERWNAIQRGLWHQIWNPQTPESWILRPFFEAHLAERPDIKLHLPEDDWNKEAVDVYLEKWHPEYMTKEVFEKAWSELEALGIIRKAWYKGGAERAHYELDPVFFEAFRGGIDGSWKNDSEAIKHTLYYLGEQPR